MASPDLEPSFLHGLEIIENRVYTLLSTLAVADFLITTLESTHGEVCAPGYTEVEQSSGLCQRKEQEEME